MKFFPVHRRLAELLHDGDPVVPGEAERQRERVNLLRLPPTASLPDGISKVASATNPTRRHALIMSSYHSPDDSTLCINAGLFLLLF